MKMNPWSSFVNDKGGGADQVSEFKKAKDYKPLLSIRDGMLGKINAVTWEILTSLAVGKTSQKRKEVGHSLE